MRTDLGTLGGRSWAEGINEAGHEVGASQTASGAYHATLWQPPLELQIEDLGDAVEDLVATGILSSGNGNALISKLNRALDSLAKGNDIAAMNKILAFINQVQAFIARENPILTPDQGQKLIDAANAIVDQILAGP